MQSEEIIDFWFHQIEPKQWFVKDPAFDLQLLKRFSAVHAAANRCELYHWRKTPQGRLAEIIVLDQFSRNMFRDTPQSFASDPLALALAQEAIATGADQDLESKQKAFLYMPFMHSESLEIHQVALALFSQSGLEDNLAFEIKHKEIIEKFGRYPHRNAILGRGSSAEEIKFLNQPGSSF